MQWRDECAASTQPSQHVRKVDSGSMWSRCSMRCNRVLECSAQRSHLSMRKEGIVTACGAAAQRDATERLNVRIQRSHFSVPEHGQ
eukprot:5399472-Karenia_brevis.AAC.2